MAKVEEEAAPKREVNNVVWRPSREYIRRSRLWRFMRRHGLKTFPELLQRSTQDPEWFWDAVARELGKALRPEEVRFVGDLPKTRNAKVMRRLIRAKYLGLARVGDTSSLENPAALEEIARSR